MQSACESTAPPSESWRRRGQRGRPIFSDDGVLSEFGRRGLWIEGFSCFHSCELMCALYAASLKISSGFIFFGCFSSKLYHETLETEEKPPWLTVSANTNCKFQTSHPNCKERKKTVSNRILAPRWKVQSILQNVSDSRKHLCWQSWLLGFRQPPTLAAQGKFTFPTQSEMHWRNDGTQEGCLLSQTLHELARSLAENFTINHRSFQLRQTKARIFSPITFQNPKKWVQNYRRQIQTGLVPLNVYQH